MAVIVCTLSVQPQPGSKVLVIVPDNSVLDVNCPSIELVATQPGKLKVVFAMNVVAVLNVPVNAPTGELVSTMISGALSVIVSVSTVITPNVQVSVTGVDNTHSPE